MKRSILTVIIILASLPLLGCLARGDLRIDLVREEERDAFIVSGLSQEDLVALRDDSSMAGWERIFTVRVDAGEGENLPAMVGEYYLHVDSLRFEPDFPLSPGVSYRAALQLGELEIEQSFALPPPDLTPRASVDRVYPSNSLLPENLLKFYIQFSSPMTQGIAYDHIRLFNGIRPVSRPFLQLGEELWDPDGKRFTLFLDPGRVKRELIPHEEEGPVFESGRRYTLEIDSGWLDARGARLTRAFRKSFLVGPPDYESPDPQKWKFEPPVAGSMDPLVVEFREPLDRALLERLIWPILIASGEIAGDVEIPRGERSWIFHPAKPWPAGKCRLEVQTTLEDRAGNSVGRPFEVDVAQKIRRRIEVDTVDVRFEIEVVKGTE